MENQINDAKARKKCYEFELLVIDDTGKACISTEKNFLLAICANEQVWKAPEIKGNQIEDSKLEISLRVKVADISGQLALATENQAMFFVIIKGSNFDSIESFRLRILVHLQKLGFRHIRILKDDVSTSFAVQLYPLINRAENTMRSFLVKFFIQKVGLDWWGMTAPKTVQDKVKSRKTNEPYFSNMIDTDVTLCDFDDLGELIYKQTTGFNSPDKIVDKIMKTASVDELEKLKGELQGNYTKYFKESFQDKNFATIWQQLFNIRNKVAHNNLMVATDLKIAKESAEILDTIIVDAEKLIKDFTFSTEDKQAFFDASVAQINAESADSDQPPIGDEVGVKIVGKIDLPEAESTRFYKQDVTSYDRAGFYKVIDEDTLIEQIRHFHTFSDNVSVKGVVEALAKRGYERKLIYSLTDLLVDKQVLQYYTYENENGFEARGVKIVE